MCIRDSVTVPWLADAHAAGAHAVYLACRIGLALDRIEFVHASDRRVAVVRGADVVICLLYTSDAADDLLCVALGGSRTIKKKKRRTTSSPTIHPTNPLLTPSRSVPISSPPMS